MPNRSIKIKVAPGHRVEELDANDLRKKAESIVRVQQDARLGLSLMNERWFHGDQWSDEEHFDDEDAVWSAWDDNVPKLEHNIVGNSGRNMVARILEMLPVTVFYPRSGYGGDIMVSQTINRILEHYWDALSWQRKQYDAVLHSLLHGTAGYKPVFDPMKGPYTAATDPEGDIDLDVVYLPDLGTDGAGNIERSKWAYHTRMIDRHDAIDMLMDAGYSSDAAHLAVRTENTSEREGDDLDALFAEAADEGHCVRAVELWWVPCSLFPKGLYITWVGDNVVENTDFPYDHFELPFALIRYVPRRDASFGSTPFDSMVKLQRMYNEVLSVMDRRFWEYRFNWVYADESVIQQMKNNSLFLKRPTKDSPAPEVITADLGVSDFESVLQFLENKIAEQAGVPQVLVNGQGFTGSTPGKTVGYLSALVSQQTIGTLWEIFEAGKRVARQILELVQQHFDVERVTRILGPGSELQAEAFLMADLDDYDVKAEPGAGDQVSRAARAAGAADAMANGTMDPATGNELTQTGLSQTEDEWWHVHEVNRLVSEILNGADAEPDPDLDPAIAARELRRHVVQHRDKPGIDGLEDALSYYEAAATQALPPQAGGAPPAGQPIPGRGPLGPAGIPMEAP